MSEPVISIKNLAKRYYLRHNAAGSSGYVALRDVIADNAKKFAKRVLNPFEKKPGQTREDFWALNDVSFDIQPGDRVGIIGRNGAGKSTLLKILSRITDPTRGSLRIRGRVASLLEVGTGFHPELTGRENIFLNGAILGMPSTQIRRKFDEIVAFAEVERFLDTPVKRYSSGMYVRLAFAVAAHLEPDILIVDEVLAVGDAGFQKKCLNKMEDVGQQGRTVLFVSHNMATVTRLCQRAILMQQGKVIADGPAHKIVGEYLNEGASTTAVREWDVRNAPGNEFARLRAVRVFDDSVNTVSDAIDIRNPIRLEVEYDNVPSDQLTLVSIELYDDNGTCLFASGDYVNASWRKAPRNFTGRVKSSCLIPGNFFAEGQIRVLVGLTTHTPIAVLAMERDAVSFLIVDKSEGDGARGEFVGHFPGVVRPVLQWRVESPLTSRS